MKKTWMGRALVWGLLCLLLISVFPVTAHADMGPKPSVQVTFKNMDGRVCYSTLLSKTESTGPAYAWDGDPEHIQLWDDQDPEIWQAFVNYKDGDGFYFLQWFWRCDEEGVLNWSYYPPETFKVLLYYPDTGEFLVSGVCDRYAFDSDFTVDMAKVQAGQLTVRRSSHDNTRQVAGFVVRLILTVLIELGVAWLFGFRKKELLLVIIAANVVTQAAYNLALQGIYNARGPWAAAFWAFALEPVIFAVEAAVYCLLFNRFGGEEVRRRKIVLYALAANVVSFAAGFLLSKVIPFAF